MRLASEVTLLRMACWMTLVALGLFVWSVLDPDPVPVMIAMSIGQAVGTGAFLLYLLVIIADLRRAKVLDLKKGGDDR